MTKQNFENTFFQLIKIRNDFMFSSLGNDLINNMIEQTYSRFYNDIVQYYKTNSCSTKYTPEEVLKYYYDFHCGSNINYLKKYFLILGNLLHHIINSNDLINKNFYYNVLSSQLSLNEVLFLAHVSVCNSYENDIDFNNNNIFLYPIIHCDVGEMFFANKVYYERYEELQKKYKKKK